MVYLSSNAAHDILGLLIVVIVGQIFASAFGFGKIMDLLPTPHCQIAILFLTALNNYYGELFSLSLLLLMWVLLTL